MTLSLRYRLSYPFRHLMSWQIRERLDFDEIRRNGTVRTVECVCGAVTVNWDHPELWLLTEPAEHRPGCPADDHRGQTLMTLASRAIAKHEAAWRAWETDLGEESYLAVLTANERLIELAEQLEPFEVTGTGYHAPGTVAGTRVVIHAALVVTAEMVQMMQTDSDGEIERIQAEATMTLDWLSQRDDQRRALEDAAQQLIEMPTRRSRKL